MAKLHRLGQPNTPFSLQWGSGSSGGQAHLRYNMVLFQYLDDCSRKDYFK